MYKIENFTYGAELEFADVDINNPLPEGCSWNKKDYSIVNSNGVANDPLGKTWKYGGEINTKPTSTLEDQVVIFKKIISVLDPKPVINYKCNLHIHIGIPGLRKDISGLKQVFNYTINNMNDRIFQIVSPMEKPTILQFPKREDYKLALKRYNRNLVSHRKLPKSDRIAVIISSKTSRDFFENHATKDKKGNLCWAITPRDGINFRQLWETNTIEFRHFFGTLDSKEFESCLVWCAEFLNLALNNPSISPEYILQKYPNLKFPKPKPFDANLQRGYDFTNIAHHNRNQAMENIKLWLKN